MFKAKKAGRGKVVFYDKQLGKIASKLFELSNKLHQAMQENQLQLYYQPQVDLKTNRIVGVEALARWFDPELGAISPSTFIPIAEDNGLIEAIGIWSLNSACHQLKEWGSLGISSLQVAVNISGRHIVSGKLVSNVEHALRETGINPQDLVLEITESSLMTQAEYAGEVLKELKDLGVGIAIDDFGTGYSSLTYLKRFHIDKLKIDRTFVTELPNDKDDVAIVRAILALSDVLGYQVIAEGVETEEQRIFMLENGCHEMQGYLFSKAMPADEFVKLWKKS
jgi:EAL domain-containing protein (putative c-di-GMP-specific phosphodiesterase class I)